MPTQARQSRGRQRLDSASINPTHPINPNRQSLLIIALPSEDSFLKYAVNGILNIPPHHTCRFSDETLRNIAKIFDLELLEIYHEQVQPEHIDFYKQTMLSRAFLPCPLIDRGLMRKIINRLLRLLKYMIKIPKNAYGHTVVAVYRLKA